MNCAIFNNALPIYSTVYTSCQPVWNYCGCVGVGVGMGVGVGGGGGGCGCGCVCV